jgi:aminoglycoside phosphotransferase (APT) family kinase protein
MRFQDLRRSASPLQSRVDEAILRRICAHALGRSVVLVGHDYLVSGRFNTTYRLRFGDRPPLILRLAPPPEARLFRHEADLMRRECAIQPHLALAGPVIPRLVAADFSRSLVPRDYVLLECLEGTLWSELTDKLTPLEIASVWHQFGQHVRRIHAIRGPGFGAPLTAGGKRYKRYSHWLRQLVDMHALDLRDLGLVVDGLTSFQNLLSQGRHLIDHIGMPRLVHGDLWPRNILLTRRQDRWCISGILDSERAFWGEPGAEWIFSFLPIPSEFWQSYGADLSTDYLDAPARFRRCCYEARGALQLILDSERYDCDAGFARADFVASVIHMENLLARSSLLRRSCRSGTSSAPGRSQCMPSRRLVDGDL